MLLADGTFLFATWSGLLQQLDPRNGREVSRPFHVGSQLRALHLTRAKDMLTAVRLIRAKSDCDPVGEVLCRLDIKTGKMQELRGNTFTNGMYISPDGRRILCRYIVADPVYALFERPFKWVVRATATGSSLCEHILGPKPYFSKPAWSPDGRWIVLSSLASHLFLSADTLTRAALVSGKFAERPAFHPAGTDVCLCRKDNAVIIPVEQLSRWPYPNEPR